MYNDDVNIYMNKSNQIKIQIMNNDFKGDMSFMSRFCTLYLKENTDLSGRTDVADCTCPFIASKAI